MFFNRSFFVIIVTLHGVSFLYPASQQNNVASAFLVVHSGVCCGATMTKQRATIQKSLSLPTSRQIKHLKQMKKEEDESEVEEMDILASLLPLLPFGLASILFVLLWPTLAFVRANYDFDVDAFLALKGMLESSASKLPTDEILELPALSPAEQLVGAIFGPPK